MAAEQPWLAPAPGMRELSHNVLWEEEDFRSTLGSLGTPQGGLEECASSLQWQMTQTLLSFNLPIDQ